MLRTFSVDALKLRARNAALYFQAAIMIAAGFAPLVLNSSASAAQITSRSATISTSEPQKTGVDYNFTFSYPSTTAAGVLIQFCKTPLGTCELPGTGSDYTTPRPMSLASATLATDSIPGSGASAATTTNTGQCNDVTGAARTMFCVTKGSPTASPGSAVTVNLSNVTNPGLPNDGTNVTSNYTPVYMRIAIYSDAGFTTRVHEGTVAASINQQLTVSGRVQERLNFCVGAVADEATPTGTAGQDVTFPTTMQQCSALTDPTIDLGVIDNTTVAKSPVANNPPGSLGNGKYGIAMINTNASGGASINYYSEADTTAGTADQNRAFRVPGATCNASVATLTDQCFASSTTKAPIAFGAEKFGMNVACFIQPKSTTNLVVDDNYNGTASPSTGVQATNTDCEKTSTGNEYAWNDTATSTPIATSSTVLDDEAIKFNFAATASGTTPTGAYTVRSTYIATPTF